jgi:hypothetical protein
MFAGTATLLKPLTITNLIQSDRLSEENEIVR